MCLYTGVCVGGPFLLLLSTTGGEGFRDWGPEVVVRSPPYLVCRSLRIKQRTGLVKDLSPSIYKYFGSDKQITS